MPADLAKLARLVEGCRMADHCGDRTRARYALGVEWRDIGTLVVEAQARESAPNATTCTYAAPGWTWTNGNDCTAPCPICTAPIPPGGTHECREEKRDQGAAPDAPTYTADAITRRTVTQPADRTHTCRRDLTGGSE